MTVNAAHPDLAALKQMLIAPTLAGAGQLLENVKGAIWVRNYGERVPLRGGSWHYASLAGMAALTLHSRRSNSYGDIGFRPAFVG
jgi:hypothetical protein